jgi:chemosensory pili system protein ChpA (sensor histidine kinase/response regulator)
LAAPPLPVVVHLTEVAQAAASVVAGPASVVPDTAPLSPELFAATMVLKTLPDHESTVVDLASAVSAEAAAQVSTPEVASPAVTSGGAAVPSTMLATQKMLASTPQLDPHVDADLVELFIQEAREEVAAIETAFPRWADNATQLEALVRVRRAFHTLKGSGRMVGARAVSEFAWSIESLLNRVINGTLPRSAEIVEVMADAVAELPGLVAQLANGGELPAAAGWVAARAMALAEGRDLASVAEPFLLSAGAPRPEGAPTIVTPITLALAAQELARAEGAAQAAPAALPEVLPEVLPDVLPEVLPELLPEPVVVPTPGQPEQQAPGFDPQLAEIYRAETASHLATIATYLGDCGAGHAPHAVTEAMHRACHTLAGASKMAEVPAGTALAEPLNLYIIFLLQFYASAFLFLFYSLSHFLIYLVT